MAAGLYAWFSWKIDYLVDSFEKKGYNVIMVNTDSIKIEGRYNRSDNLVTIGDGLGEFKVEYEGMAEYMSEGHYKEQREKWKGKPAYMIDGYPRCKFIENIETKGINEFIYIKSVLSRNKYFIYVIIFLGRKRFF